LTGQLKRKGGQNRMKRYSTKLKIADITIQMQSKFLLEQFSEEERILQVEERYNNFFYEGKDNPEIKIEVEIVKELPKITGAKNLFTTIHPDDNSKNWCLLKKDKTYIYRTLLEDKEQQMLINEDLNQIIAYLLPKKHKGQCWYPTDLIYDFLQVLLINYLALRKKGIFTHSVGIKDLDGRGLLFTGKSGTGKTTTAKLWHKHSRAMVLNDDRIIIRKIKGRFFIYGSPWHGEFSDYLTSRIESAPLEKIFFIYHSPQNTVRQISKKEAFGFLYPALFPTFWDKECLENIVLFSQNLVQSIPCYSLGFVNNRKVIEFVRDMNYKNLHTLRLKKMKDVK